jgi:TolA-binding protein
MANETVFPAAVQSLYQSGEQKYNERDYAEAKLLMEKAYRFAVDGSNAKSNVIYYLGIISQALDETDAAIRYFTDIIENYPNAAESVRNVAQARLDALRQ